MYITIKTFNIYYINFIDNIITLLYILLNLILAVSYLVAQSRSY
jgi:hypothetical protein